MRCELSESDKMPCMTIVNCVSYVVLGIASNHPMKRSGRFLCELVCY